jgi:hypothetical protein
LSQAFIRESDDQWLEDIQPTLTALLAFLANENNGIRINELRNFLNEKGQTIHVMSNGLSYTLDARRRWQVENEFDQ